MGCASEHSSLHHQSLVQVGRAHCDRGTITKATTNRNRRISKSVTTAGRAGGKTVNKSCDACSTKKRRCDGGRPCSRCVRRGDGHKCTYSTRRPYTSRNRLSHHWSPWTTSSERAAVGTASVASGISCRKRSTDTHCQDSNKDQQLNKRHRSVVSPADSTGHKQSISRNLDLQNPQFMRQEMSVIEASPTAGPMTAPMSHCASLPMEDVYAELARAQQGVMSLILSTNSLPLQASNNTGPDQQTSIKQQHCVPCAGDFSKLDGAGSVDHGYVEMMPRTVSLEEQCNPRSSGVPGLEIDCPVVASSASALESDSSTTDDEGSDSSTLDLDMNCPSSWSDNVTSVVHDVSVINFNQHLPSTSENITDIAAASSLDQTLSALGQEEQDIISAEDWFEVAATL